MSAQLRIAGTEKRRVRVQASDPTGNSKSKTITVFGATPAQVMEQIKDVLIGKKPIRSGK